MRASPMTLEYSRSSTASSFGFAHSLYGGHAAVNPTPVLQRSVDEGADGKSDATEDWTFAARKEVFATEFEHLGRRG